MKRKYKWLEVRKILAPFTRIENQVSKPTRKTTLPEKLFPTLPEFPFLRPNSQIMTRPNQFCLFVFVLVSPPIALYAAHPVPAPNFYKILAWALHIALFHHLCLALLAAPQTLYSTTLSNQMGASLFGDKKILGCFQAKASNIEVFYTEEDQAVSLAKYTTDLSNQILQI